MLRGRVLSSVMLNVVKCLCFNYDISLYVKMWPLFNLEILKYWALKVPFSCFDSLENLWNVESCLRCSPFMFRPVSLFVPAVWVFVTLLPTLILNTERKDEPLGPRDCIGWAVWGLGFATEALADQQKWDFKNDPDNAVSYSALLVYILGGRNGLIIPLAVLLSVWRVYSEKTHCCVLVNKILIV